MLNTGNVDHPEGTVQVIRRNK